MLNNNIENGRENMIRKSTVCTLLASAFLVLLSCIPSTGTITPTQIATPPGWIMESLENPVCFPPCWENITPGVSSIDSVQNIQQKYPDMSIETERGSSIVQMVKLNLSIYDNLPNELLISRFGKPDYVRIYKCDSNKRCEAHMVFVDLGMVLNLYPENTGKFQKFIVTISPSTSVVNIYFLEPGLNNYYRNFGGDAGKMIPWNDFGTYSSP